MNRMILVLSMLGSTTSALLIGGPIAGLPLSGMNAQEGPFDSTFSSPEGPWNMTTGHYRFRVTTRKGDPRYDKGMFHGFYASRVVKEIRVWYKGSPVVVPRSSFADLGTVQRVFLLPGAPIFLCIQGSDAGESYGCNLVFRNGELVRCEVDDGESGKRMEVTTYYR